jgi:hypothetical protein
VSSPSREAEPAASGAGERPSPPRLIVVARGHARLMAELRALFGHDAGVRVIENRRRERALLPRPELG